MRGMGVNIMMETELCGKKFTVLNDGFIYLVDFMGSDSAICQAARVSYGKGTKSVSDDEKLIRYMMRHWHTSPFEQAELKFHVRVPMDTWRQWIRHRTASVNEYSTRYSEAIDSCYVAGEWRSQSKGNKQGSDGIVDDEWIKQLDLSEKRSQVVARHTYKQRLHAGVARELARKDLPLSTYTEAYWKIDLHNLLHFLGLRMDSHAQWEIRQYANIIGNEIVSKLFPFTWDAFNDYHPKRNALLLSARDIEVIKTGEYAAEQFGWLEYSKKLSKCPCCKGDGKMVIDWGHGPITILEHCICEGKGKLHRLKRNRERQECALKLRRLNMNIPWSRWEGEI